MKLRENLLYSFLTISVFISIFGIVTLYQINEITKPLSEEIPLSLELLTTSSELDIHAQKIRYYDEVLTQSARNFAFTQNPLWNERYDETVLLLDSEINMAIADGDIFDKILFEDISIANQKLIELETNAIFFST